MASEENVSADIDGSSSDERDNEYANINTHEEVVSEGSKFHHNAVEPE